MKYQAICTDIDGTLLNPEKELSEKTIAAIKNLPDNVPVILASSRMPKAMRHLQQELGLLQHPLICYNGGLILDYSAEGNNPVILDSVQIPLAVCELVVNKAEGTQIHISLFQNDDWFAPQHDQWTAREIRNTKVEPTIASPAEVLSAWSETGAGAHKIMCMGPEEGIAAMAQALEEEVGKDIFVYKSKSTYLELAARSVSKATALKLLLQKKYSFGMQEVMAFGDNYNDIDMLQAVGLGVAVGNAREEVTTIANEITGLSTQDGVALALEKYFL